MTTPMIQAARCQCLVCSIQSLDLTTLSILNSPNNPIRALLQNNREPYHSEFRQIEAYLEQASREFLDFSSHIKQLDLLREMLRHEQDKHKEAIWKHQGVVSVVRRLPDDILRAIFLEVVDEIDHFDHLNTKIGVWTLSHVCSRWRTVALSTASMWSTISVVKPGGVTVDDLCTLVSTCLSRSRMAPLKVIFWADSDPAQSRLLPALRILCAHSSRWLAAMFVVNTPEVHECLATIENAPALERTSLLFQDSQIDSAELQFPRFAPNLKYCYVTGNKNQQVSMNQLRLFRSDTDSPGEHCDLTNVLSHLSHIEDMEMKYNQYDTIRITNAPIVLPHLEALTLECDQEIQGLQYLTLPKLEMLSLQSRSLLDKLPTHDIALMLENSRCPLITLCCTSRTFDTEELHRVLLAVPTLQDFDLQVRDLDTEGRDMFEILTCRENTKVVVPLLEQFKVSILNMGLGAFGCRKVYDKMVRSRTEYCRERGQGEFEAELEIGMGSM